MERRQFLSAAALLAIKPDFSQGSAFFQNNLKDISDDDTYWEKVRDMFSLDRNKTFLNNGTMGIMPIPVMAALQTSFRNTADNAQYPSHNEQLQTSIGELIGADASEIAITKNVSEGTNLACWGIPLKKGAEVILTRHEHVGGSMPWLHRARVDGIKIIVVEIGKTAEATLDNVKKAITKKTRVIAVPHIPCTIGQILPVKEICALAKSKNIISCVDGAHPLGMLQFNVKEIDCDYYYGCLHKWMLGPVGVGFFYVRKEMLDKTRCMHIAAYSANEFNMSQNPPLIGSLVPSAQRFSYGTFCGPLHDAANAAIKFYKEIGPEKIENRSRGLATYLQNSLLNMGDKIDMVTSTEAISRGSQIGFRIKSNKPKPNSDFVTQCAKNNMILRYVGESGIDCIRVSSHYYNNTNELDSLVNEVKKYIDGK